MSEGVKPETAPEPDDSPVRVFAITDENRDTLADIALAGMTRGRACIFCGHVYDGAADARERDVRVATLETRELACGPCWDEQDLREPHLKDGSAQ